MRAVQGGAALPGVRLSWSQRGEVVKISEMGVLILLTHVGLTQLFEFVGRLKAQRPGFAIEDH